jgi:hypothetical protein
MLWGDGTKIFWGKEGVFVQVGETYRLASGVKVIFWARDYYKVVWVVWPSFNAKVVRPPTWFLTFSSLKYRVWRTWFWGYFKLELYRLHQAEKSSSNYRKVSNQVHQTWYFKLENVKPCADRYGERILDVWCSATLHTLHCESNHRVFSMRWWR